MDPDFVPQLEEDRFGGHSGVAECRTVGWGEERNILYKSVEVSLLQTRFKNLKSKPKRKIERRQYRLVVELSCYRFTTCWSVSHE